MTNVPYANPILSQVRCPNRSDSELSFLRAMANSCALTGEGRKPKLKPEKFFEG